MQYFIMSGIAFITDYFSKKEVNRRLPLYEKKTSEKAASLFLSHKKQRFCISYPQRKKADHIAVFRYSFSGLCQYIGLSFAKKRASIRENWIKFDFRRRSRELLGTAEGSSGDGLFVSSVGEEGTHFQFG